MSHLTNVANERVNRCGRSVELGHQLVAVEHEYAGHTHYAQLHGDAEWVKEHVLSIQPSKQPLILTCKSVECSVRAH